MLHQFSSQLLHYKKVLQNILKQQCIQVSTSDIFISSHCNKIICQHLSQLDLFGCGYKKIYTKQNISPYLSVDKMIVVSNVNKQEIQELEEFYYLFGDLYLITLQTTTQKYNPILRNSKVRNHIKIIRQVNLNFHTFLDHSYMVNKIHKYSQKKQKMKQSNKQKQQNSKQKQSIYKQMIKQQKISAYRSFLVSFPKIYQYQLHTIKEKNKQYSNLVNELQSELKQCLQNIQSHSSQCLSYDKTSSPKIKCLILSRNIINDFISPLVSSIFYGSLCQQFINKSKINVPYLNCSSKLYNTLFSLDLQQTALYLKKLTNDKTVLEGPFQTNYFYKAKKIIAEIKEPAPLQLGFHIFTWKQNKANAQKIINNSIVMQNIANRRDQYDRKMDHSMVIKQINKWIQKSNDQTVTQEQYMKLAMLAELTGNLWFYQKYFLRNRFQNEQKAKYQRFIQLKKTLPIGYLAQKPQSQQRSQLYRHMPSLIPTCINWLKNTLSSQKSQKSDLYEIRKINNNLLKTRQVKLVILIDGMVGYNQLILLRRAIKQFTQKDVMVVAEAYCNAKQYIQYLTR